MAENPHPFGTLHELVRPKKKVHRMTPPGQRRFAHWEKTKPGLMGMCDAVAARVGVDERRSAALAAARHKRARAKMGLTGKPWFPRQELGPTKPAGLYPELPSGFRPLQGRNPFLAAAIRAERKRSKPKVGKKAGHKKPGGAKKAKRKKVGRKKGR